MPPRLIVSTALRMSASNDRDDPMLPLSIAFVSILNPKLTKIPFVSKQKSTDAIDFFEP